MWLTGETRATLFDVDGTLVDSNDAHARAWVAAFAASGYEVPLERVRAMIGMGGDHIFPALVPGLSSESTRGKEIGERRKAIFLEREAPNLKPAPGARELVLALRERAVRLVLATSAEPDELKVLLRAAGVADLFEAASTSEDAASSKPAPDVVMAALRKAALEPSEAIMVGDTPYDVEASRRAGVACVAVRCGGWDDAALADAVAIFDNPAAMLRDLR